MSEDQARFENHHLFCITRPGYIEHMASRKNHDRTNIAPIADHLFKLSAATLTLVAFCAAYLLAIGISNWTRVMISERANAMKFYKEAIILHYEMSSSKPPANPVDSFYSSNDPGHQVLSDMLVRMKATVSQNERNGLERAIVFCRSYNYNLDEMEKSQARAFEAAKSLGTMKLPFLDLDVNSRDFLIGAPMILGTLLLGLAINTTRLRKAIRLSCWCIDLRSYGELESNLLVLGVHYRIVGARFFVYGHGMVLFASLGCLILFFFFVSYFLSKQVALSPYEQFLIQNPRRLVYSLVALTYLFASTIIGIVSALSRTIISLKMPDSESDFCAIESCYGG